MDELQHALIIQLVLLLRNYWLVAAAHCRWLSNITRLNVHHELLFIFWQPEVI